MFHRFTLHLILFFVLKISTVSCQYFQQHVSYKIDVALDDKSHFLNAFETIEYTNNSRFALTSIYFHLWPNAYKDETTQLFKQTLDDGSTKMYNANEEQRGYIDSLDFYVDNKKAEFHLLKDSIDIMILTLNEPLPPGKKITITTPFRVKIPDASFSRMGHNGQAYYITQWYPKPAVFDQFGWHQMPYLTQGEFYSEFGDYDVKIILPANYTVGATGDLQTASELERLEKLNDNNFDKFDMAFPLSDTETKTLQYKQINVHDFGWVADKRFHVLKGEVELPNTKRKVTLWAMFTPLEDHLWKNSIEYMHDAAYYYSLWNGDYPYNQITAVDGTIAAGGGMEYPNMTIIGQSRTAHLLEMVIVHEIGHNWFYGILGSNERDHGWMDEGINSFNEMRYVYTKYPIEKFDNRNELSALGKFSHWLHVDKLSDKQVRMGFYKVPALRKTSQAIETKSPDFTSTNYGSIMYTKTALAFDYLKNYLGTEMFDKCMQTYFETWKFKHPYPNDIKNVFMKMSDQNLAWFFDSCIPQDVNIDFKLKKVKLNPDQTYTVYVDNKNLPGFPYNIITYRKGKQVSNKWIWPGKSETIVEAGDYDRIGIGNDEAIPDINMYNNAKNIKGIFKRGIKSKLRFLTGLEDGLSKQLYWNPVAGYNLWDGTMLGASLHNFDSRPKKFNFHISPLYGFNSNSLAGFGFVSVNFYSKKIADISFDLAARHFGEEEVKFIKFDKTYTSRYTSLVPGVHFNFKPKNLKSVNRHVLTLQSFMVWSNNNFVVSNDNAEQKSTNEIYPQIKYNYDNKRTLDPYDFEACLEMVNGDFTWRPKLTAAFRYYLSYGGMRKAFTARIFAGITSNGTKYSQQGYASGLYMSGTNTNLDYRYEYLFLGRNEYSSTNIASHQMVANEGGFKMYTATANSGKWITSINLSARIPKLNFIGVFADVGTYYNAGKTYDGSKEVVFDAGASLIIVQNAFEIYFPLKWSSDIERSYEANNSMKYSDKIRFQLNLHLVKPYKYLSQLF